MSARTDPVRRPPVTVLIGAAIALATVFVLTVILASRATVTTGVAAIALNVAAIVALEAYRRRSRR